MKSQILIKHGMLSLSSICPGEVFAAYIYRQHHHPVSGLSRRLGGSEPLSWLLPNGIEDQVNVLTEFVGSIDRVIDNNTLLPGYSRFLSEEDGQRLRLHHLGTAYPGIVATVGLNTHGRPGQAWSPGVCDQCLNEDRSVCGDAFWRRDFLLSGVRWCTRHHRPIQSLCPSCLYRLPFTKRFSGPSNSCVCGRALISRPRNSDFEDLELDLSRGWTRMLDPTFSPYTRGSEIAALTRAKAISLGLANSRTVEWKNFQDYFDHPILKAFGTDIAFPFRNETTRDMIRGKRSIRNPIHALFLLIALFGNWNAVEDAIQGAAQNFPEDSRKRRKRAAVATKERNRLYWKKYYSESIALLPQTSQLYEKLRKDNPELGHLAIRRLLPCRHGLAATSERLREHGACPPPTEGDKEHAAAKDISAALHIERRWRELIQAGTKVRLSKSLLLWGHPLHGQINDPAVRARSPRTKAALEKYVETAEMRRRRVIRTEVLAGKIPRYPPSEAYKIDSLTDREIVSLMDHCKYLRRKTK